jgi:hypothetical protein
MNDFSNNTEAGMFIGGSAMGGTNTAVNTLGSIDMNNFNRDTLGTAGILFGSSDVRTTASITRNTFIGRAPAGADLGAGFGVGGTVGGTTTVGGNGGVTLAFGSLAAIDNSLANTFMNNGDAHIGLELQGNTTNQVDIDQQIFDTTNDTTLNANFNGEGVGFLMSDTATFTGTIQRNVFQNSAASGLRIDATGNNLGDFAIVNNVTIGGTTAAFGNLFTANGGNGMEMTRTADGVITNTLIRFNMMTGNTLDGIALTSSSASKTDTYTINDNTITGNMQNGVELRVEADAGLSANMTRNTITGNTSNGILTTELQNSFADERFVTGAWTVNNISNNGANGIDLQAASNGLVIGDAADPALGNLIQNNTQDGVNITGSGSVTVARNMIAENTVHGIDLDLEDFSEDHANVITISNNDITMNQGDGIEYSNVSSSFNPTDVFTVNITGNVIDFNNGRGFDVLARPGNGGSYSETAITFNNNIVNRNDLEGIYVVYTADDAQNQTDPATDPLANMGSTLRDVYLRFSMDSNIVVDNGINSGFSSTGLVVRVGTTRSFSSTTTSGGFASDGLGNFLNSGVIMTATNNSLTGNLGDDVYFESFASTVDPTTTAGTWGNTINPTAITAFRTDPLARLDLDWDGNTILSSDTTNIGAFYDNADTFKSRLNNVASPGPFTSTSRRRNAQRLAVRIPNLNAPGTTGPADFRYSGLGASTFRVDSTGDLGIFTLDTNPFVTTPNDANGVLLPGTITGELPFGWGQF